MRHGSYSAAVNGLPDVRCLQVMTEFTDCMHRLDQEHTNVGTIVVTGEGNKAFAAGADIKQMANLTYAQASAFTLLQALAEASSGRCATWGRQCGTHVAICLYPASALSLQACTSCTSNAWTGGWCTGLEL